MISARTRRQKSRVSANSSTDMPGIRCSSVAASMALPARNAASAKIECTCAFEDLLISEVFRLTQANWDAQCIAGEISAWEEMTITLAVRSGNTKHPRPFGKGPQTFLERRCPIRWTVPPPPPIFLAIARQEAPDARRA